jgi:hypothetical protein
MAVDALGAHKKRQAGERLAAGAEWSDQDALQAVRYTACPDRSWLGGLYDYGHREPAVTEHHAEVRAPWLTVRLPASTRVRLTLTLALRTRPPSYTTPFDGDLGLPS